MRRLLLTTAGLACFASIAGAYSHFVHYTGRSFPYNPAQEKFDLTSLPNKTVTFLVADSTAGRISKSELYPTVLNAIRESARIWNGVETSDLRVAFGGIAPADLPQDSPGADIVFEEMDPLLLGLTSTNSTNTFFSQNTGMFVPIKRPVIRLNRDLGMWTTGSSGPSFTEAFFLTVVHEMGHALGLQHTFTASAMSTEITRATSLYTPITSDDVAGLSYLYPRNFGQSTGSISGRITFAGGQGVHLASVVAIRPTGGAISAMTDPDGRYRIDGVTPGSYVVYVHPLPPPRRAGATPGDIVLPTDPDGRPVAGDGPFDTLFFQGSGAPGTRDYRQAQTVNVSAGTPTENVTFTTNRRSAYGPISAVTTYSYYDQTPVRPGYLNTTGTLVAVGAGLLTGGAITPGLSVNFLGGTPVLLPTGGLLAYSGSLVIYLNLPSTFGGVGPRAIVFSTPDDIYVLPSGLNMVQRRPPFMSVVTAVTENSGARALAIEGTTLASDTRFYFDGVPGNLLRMDDTGRAIVAPPAGVAGVRASITAFNPDGQNSMFLQASSAPTYSYDTGDPGFISLAPATLPAGAESLVEVTGVNGNFVEGVTKLGFGSSDVQVRRTWVVGPNRMLANVWVAPNASVLPVTASVVNGFQVIAQPFALQLVPSNGKPSLSSQAVNAAPPIEGVFPGAMVTVSGVNLAGTLTLNDRSVAVVSSSASQITFVIPADVAIGPAVLKLSNGPDSASVVIAVGAAPPDIRSVTLLGDIAVDTNHPARVGDTLNLLVWNLTDAGTVPDFTRIRVTIGGVDHTVRAVTPVAQGHQVQVIVAAGVPAGLDTLIVAVDGRNSQPYSLAVNP